MRPIINALAVLPMPTHNATSSLYQELIQIVRPAAAGAFTLAEYNSALEFLQKRIILDNTATSPAKVSVSETNARSLKKDLLSSDSGLGLSTVYGSARMSLIDSYGQFCSYCEMRVGDSTLAVEHVLPKSMFLDKAATAGNLLLACHTCNSFKSNNPTDFSGDYYWPVQWSNPPIPSKYNHTTLRTWIGYLDVQNVLYNAYMWPQYINAYRSFITNYAYYSPGQINVAPDLGDNINSHNNGVIQANVVNAAPAGVYKVLTVISGTTGSITANTVPVTAPTPPVTAANPSSTSMVARYDTLTGDGLLNLNNEDTASSFSDRRMYNRTLAFFSAINSFNRLVHAMANGGAPIYNLFLGEVVSTASATGFFSTWVTVFNTFAPANSGPWPGTGPTRAAGGTSIIPDATVDFIMHSTGNVVPLPAVVGFPGTNINSTIP